MCTTDRKTVTYESQLLKLLLSKYTCMYLYTNHAVICPHSRTIGSVLKSEPAELFFADLFLSEELYNFRKGIHFFWLTPLLTLSFDLHPLAKFFFTHRAPNDALWNINLKKY